MGFYYLSKDFLSTLESCNYTFILLIQHTYLTYKLITNLDALSSSLISSKRRVGKMFSLVTLSQLRGGHMPFCLSFPLLLLKFNLRVVEPQIHTLQGHSYSTHKTRNAVFVGVTLPYLRRRSYLGNKALFVAFWF